MEMTTESPDCASPEEFVADSKVSDVIEMLGDGVSGTQTSAQNSSYYTLACDQSLLSGDVDRWVRGSITTETTGVQHSRPTVVQRSTLVTEDVPLISSRTWAALTLAMPLLNAANIGQWRCSQSAVLNIMELVISHMNTACSRIRRHLRRLAHNQPTRELLASAMDAVLVVYAIGFLILSAYETALIA